MPIFISPRPPHRRPLPPFLLARRSTARRGERGKALAMPVDPSVPRLEALEGRDDVAEPRRAARDEALPELGPDQRAEVAQPRLDHVEEALLREHRLGLRR